MRSLKIHMDLHTSKFSHFNPLNSLQILHSQIVTVTCVKPVARNTQRTLDWLSMHALISVANALKLTFAFLMFVTASFAVCHSLASKTTKLTSANISSRTIQNCFVVDSAHYRCQRTLTTSTWQNIFHQTLSGSVGFAIRNWLMRTL